MIKDKPFFKSKGKLGALILIAYALTALGAKLFLGMDVITYGDAIVHFAEGLTAFGIRDALPRFLPGLLETLGDR